MQIIVYTRANPSYGGTTRKHLKEFLKEPKVARSFSWAFEKKFTIKFIYLFSNLSSACFHIWLEFYFGIKKNC